METQEPAWIEAIPRFRFIAGSNFACGQAVKRQVPRQGHIPVPVLVNGDGDHPEIQWQGIGARPARQSLGRPLAVSGPEIGVGSWRYYSVP